MQMPDEELTREMSDLTYHVERIQEDLEFNSRGTQTATRANERRRPERELLSLMHELIPEVERKTKDREERKERERRCKREVWKIR
jgi:actin cytoskeleton-regulatory complex protein PAN1